MINKRGYNLLIEQDTLNLAAPGKVCTPRKRVLNRLRDIFAIYRILQNNIHELELI